MGNYRLLHVEPDKNIKSDSPLDCVPYDEVIYPDIVMVKHKGSCKRYCFAVPDELIDKIEVGTPLLCKTKYGVSTGRATTSVISGRDTLEIARACHATVPLSEILAVVDEIAISDIACPRRMDMIIPRGEKMGKRFDEYRKYGVFNTDVTLNDKSNWLKDGYTAFLAAKALGLETIPYISPSVFQFSQVEKKNDYICSL